MQQKCSVNSIVGVFSPPALYIVSEDGCGLTYKLSEPSKRNIKSNSQSGRVCLRQVLTVPMELKCVSLLYC